MLRTAEFQAWLDALFTPESHPLIAQAHCTHEELRYQDRLESFLRAAFSEWQLKYPNTDVTKPRELPERTIYRVVAETRVDGETYPIDTQEIPNPLYPEAKAAHDARIAEKRRVLAQQEAQRKAQADAATASYNAQQAVKAKSQSQSRIVGAIFALVIGIVIIAVMQSADTGGDTSTGINIMSAFVGIITGILFFSILIPRSPRRTTTTYYTGVGGSGLHGSAMGYAAAGAAVGYMVGHHRSRPRQEPGADLNALSHDYADRALGLGAYARPEPAVAPAPPVEIYRPYDPTSSFPMRAHGKFAAKDGVIYEQVQTDPFTGRTFL